MSNEYLLHSAPELKDLTLDREAFTARGLMMELRFISNVPTFWMICQTVNNFRAARYPWARVFVSISGTWCFEIVTEERGWPVHFCCSREAVPQRVHEELAAMDAAMRMGLT